jgi:ABC-type Fe3+ transport system permease subunit
MPWWGWLAAMAGLGIPSLVIAAGISIVNQEFDLHDYEGDEPL